MQSRDRHASCCNTDQEARHALHIKEQGIATVSDRISDKMDDGFPWSRRYISRTGERPAMMPRVSVPAARLARPVDTEEIRAAREKFDTIQSVLNELPGDEVKPESTVELPLARILEWIPRNYVAHGQADAETDCPVSVTINDLFGQLARGNVTVPVATLVLDVPPGCVTSEAYRDTMQQVSVPLDMVVDAIDPQALIERTTTTPPAVDFASIPDPFREPATETGAAETVSGPQATELDERTAPLLDEVAPAASGVAAESPAVQVRVDYARPSIQASGPGPAVPGVGAAATAWIDTEAEMEDRLGGVNVNVADEEQLRALDGVTPALARRIVEYRASHGPFRSVFELIHVPRLGRVRFRRMTGMPFSRNGRHRIRKLINLLGLMPGEAHRMSSVVARVLARPGFGGCLVSDHEGLLLAHQGIGERAPAMAAVIPRLFENLDANLAEMDTGSAGSISVCIEKQMITIVSSRRIYLAVMHDRRRLTKGELTFAGRVTEELAWLLSHRAYAGRVELPGHGKR